MKNINKKNLIKTSYSSKWLAAVDLKNFRIWLGLFFALLFTGIIIAVYAENIASIFNLKNQIEGLISDGKLTSIQQIYEWASDKGQLGIGSEEMAFLKFVYSTGDDQTSKILISVNLFDYLIYYSSFFTTISNVLIASWMMIYVIKPYNLGVKGILNSKMTITAAVAITVTMLVYNAVLLPTNEIPIELNWYWISQLFLHILMPISFIGFSLFAIKHDLNNYTKEKLFAQWKFQLIPLFGYVIYVMIRGLIRTASGYDASTNFPYFFLNVTTKSGQIWIVPIIILVFGIMLGFSSLYFLIIKKVNKKTL
ncbi:Pr6Pr family membrane protein [Mesoplasma photuris]|uniref:Pr6Pr family membrane protein n=1 Tax=Mesoplasma photuris TaxID=217731 RepID=UPI0004E220E3|nr:Pr6Pr family membrane protein [Mesoplasma photuris]